MSKDAIRYKVTLASTLPFKLREAKYGLVPSLYEVPASTLSDKGKIRPGVLHIADGYHDVLIPLSDDRAPAMRVVDTAEKIAESLINDYINANLSISWDPLDNGAMAIPGLFFVDGKLSVEDVELRCPRELEASISNTKAWFERLVKLADDDWAKYHQYKMITDLQRSACKYLNLSREWNFDVFTNEQNLCWGCKSLINPQAIKCAHCGAILQVEEYEKKKALFAV